MTTETSTIDKLFLELSQFTRAITRKELIYGQALQAIRDSMAQPWIDPAEHANWCVQQAEEAVRRAHE